MTNFEFFETPATLTRYLFSTHDIRGVIYEPCVGSGAIVRASATSPGHEDRHWITNDLDARWPADGHDDAAADRAWSAPCDWVVTNTPFSAWHEIAEQALRRARVGVALYLRLSAHEPAKSDWRDWWQRHAPTSVDVCPRFAHQRSKKSGEWATDTVTCCWTVWDKRASGQRIRYAPAWVLDELAAETPDFRARMDALMAARAAA